MLTRDQNPDDVYWKINKYVKPKIYPIIVIKENATYSKLKPQMMCHLVINKLKHNKYKNIKTQPIMKCHLLLRSEFRIPTLDT